ncbi:MAG TPA: DNA cytosine methyltransferase [Terracidiphilus sp.]|nr:DNA cytosine methyltransferase [Terracidiphilus sp.]
MTKKRNIAVVDLFAGPGGLGEGFSSLKEGTGSSATYPFRIALSVEKEEFAWRTLRLRAYYRLLILQGKSLTPYYDYVAGRARSPYNQATESLWERAGEEAIQFEIGSEGAGRTLHAKVKQIQEQNEHWILVGGPPCQAYSLVGRARNKGNKDYKPEEDKRHFLYTHYLELIRKFRPSIFVMENVKGILSSKVSGMSIFGKLLEDLRAADTKDRRAYRIYSLAKGASVYTGPDGKRVDPHDFIVRSEFFGIPQARHRVILLGIREDVAPEYFVPLDKKVMVTVSDALRDLPKLRSGLSKNDSVEKWKQTVREQAQRAIDSLRELDSAEDRKRIGGVLRSIVNGKLPHTCKGALRTSPSKVSPTAYGRKMRDKNLAFVLNHEARRHMEKDLARYLYAAAYALVHGVSPSQKDYPKSLAPAHKNWFSGNFADRFRVQLRSEPSTTVTCHIAKDGHYYIHFDPRQCRSLTVREAARLQSFPDNYFFEGNRTQQYVQVGNAVPPMLARQIAKKVRAVLKD